MTLSGSRLADRYQVTDLIGRGAVGEVWRAVDEWEAPLAIKVIDVAPGLGRDAEQRFYAERDRLTGIRHPNVVQVRDLLVLDGAQIAIVMDVAEGGDLAAMLGHDTLPPVDVAAVGGQVAYGLGALHGKGFAHRALRPHNVMLHDVNGLLTAQITDFAVHRLGAAGLVTLPAESVHRNLPYQAPELTAGGVPTPRSDLYALGIMLYQLSSGVRPFDGVPDADLAHAHANLAPGRPPGVPDVIWDQIAALLAKDPQGRPGDADEVAGRLARIRERVEGQPAARRLPAPPSPLGPRVGEVSSAPPAALYQSVSHPPVHHPPVHHPPVHQPPVQQAPVHQPPVHQPPVHQAPPSPHLQHPYAPAGQGAMPPDDENGGSRLGVYLALGVLAVVVAVVAWLMLGGMDGETASPSTAGTTTAQTTGQTTAPPSSTTSAQRTTATSTAAPSTPPASTPVRPPFPNGVTACNEAVGVNANTSCEFAAVVANAWLATSKTGTTTVQATSPVTNQTYTMTCVAGPVTVCTGGNNAAVYIR